MKLIISENKIKKYINQVITNTIYRHYGNLTHNISKDGYHSWFSDKWSRNIPFDDTPNRPFHKNIWGMLWVESGDFYSDLKSELSLFSLSDGEKDRAFINYMNEKYDTNIKALDIDGE